jgi:predicted  nucleic acid-binding Zn-ribbon protein
MNASTHLEMHRDHRDWEAEIQGWQADLQAWLTELANAKKDLPKLEQAFSAHERTLQDRAAALESLFGDVSAHEEALADYEQGGTGQRLIGMAGRHVQQAAQRPERRDAHEQLKQHHRDLLSRWRRLWKATSPPTEQPPARTRISLSEPEA